jgi:hypothetical protein
MSRNPEIDNILGITNIRIPSKNNILTIVPIGSVSANGFVNKITYSNNVTAILKSTQDITADNLYYEWYVGCSFINRWCSIFPCFCETYSLCNYLSSVPYDELKRRQPIMNGSTLKRSDVDFIDACAITDINTIKSCTTPSLFGILIQDIPRAMSFHDFARQQRTDYELNVIMVQILLQIYIPLGILADQFTHYDLHTGNVLIYTLPANKYVTLIYTIPERTEPIKMKTKYIAKIIDYGRCFFNNGVVSSANFYNNNIRNKNECRNLRQTGYGWFDTNAVNLNPRVVNKTRDLWLVWLYKSSLNRAGVSNVHSSLKKIYDEIRIGHLDGDPVTGYPRDLEITSCTPNICTVKQFMNELCTYYDSYYSAIRRENNKYVSGASYYGKYSLPVPPGRAPVVQPAAVYGQPTAVYGQPAAVYGQPTAVYGQPAAVYGQPAVHGQQPAVHGQQPAVHGQQPAVHGHPPGMAARIAAVKAEAEQRAAKAEAERRAIQTSIGLIIPPTAAANAPVAPPVAPQKVDAFAERQRAFFANYGRGHGGKRKTNKRKRNKRKKTKRC